MDKEEILRRSRAEDNDELEIQRRERGMAKVMRLTLILLYVVLYILGNYGFITSWVPYVFLGVSCIPAAVWYLYNFIRTRDGGDLVSAVVLVVCMLGSGHLLWTML